MQTGRSSSIKGGGGNGGNISGKISKDAVRQTSKSKDSKLKQLTDENILLLAFPCENDLLYSIFLPSTPKGILVFDGQIFLRKLLGEFSFIVLASIMQHLLVRIDQCSAVAYAYPFARRGNRILKTAQNSTRFLANASDQPNKGHFLFKMCS